MNRFLPLLVSCLLLAGCAAVLTPSQVAEVATFAQATADYSELPDTVMRAHADLHRQVKLANAATALSGKNARKLLEEALRFETEMGRKADRAEIACGVLQDYGALLLTLTAEEPAARISGSAVRIGESLDAGIARYNQITGGSISGFGKTVAAIVRGAAGIYIRHQQLKALQSAVSAGSEAVAEMAAGIRDLLDLYAPEGGEGGLRLITATRDDLLDWYEAAGYRGALPAAQAVARQVEQADAAEVLARQARDAIDKLTAAHEALARKLETRITLKSAIETVQVFAAEVEAAKDIQDQLAGE